MIEFLTGPGLQMLVGNFLSMYLMRHMHRTFYEGRNFAEKHENLVLTFYLAYAFVMSFINSLEIPPMNFVAMLTAVTIRSQRRL